jgi:hypothetical protein
MLSAQAPQSIQIVENRSISVIFRMFCSRSIEYPVYFNERILEQGDSLIAELLQNRKALIVTTPTVARFY